MTIHTTAVESFTDLEIRIVPSYANVVGYPAEMTLGGQHEFPQDAEINVFSESLEQFMAELRKWWEEETSV